MGNMHTIPYQHPPREAPRGREAAGDGRDADAIQARFIEQNLKRAYQATLTEQLPPRFHALLAALRQKEERK